MATAPSSMALPFSETNHHSYPWERFSYLRDLLRGTHCGALAAVAKKNVMDERMYMADQQVSEGYHGSVSVGTLKNGEQCGSSQASLSGQ
ncbi:hypothetical protein QN224_30940 [Sinorhizobium sp. 8-89]|uniref:hypothetical protein n=1 Tax=Sinorhizobium sp. 7-81 TaxID=3049087 RepID=UPI0024C41133|nr:hypothetical protein [Sinorhizobium sp. 7-81]MDK1389774.1 hypothetical protein [Sinorhizobium sp. 7-81]